MNPTHFAEIDEKGIVLRVIVADQKFIDSGAVGDPKNWVSTCPDRTFKKNYAMVGGTYDEKRDAFLEPQPFKSWTLNEDTCRWEPPVKIDPIEEAGCMWDEKQQGWIKISTGQVIKPK